MAKEALIKLTAYLMSSDLNEQKEHFSNCSGNTYSFFRKIEGWQVQSSGMG